jgi:hypothetical protein
MDSILEQCECAVGITDDIAVHGATEKEHINQRLHQLMQVAEKNGLVLNSEKCTIMQSEISFFVMIYGINGIKPDPKKVKDLQAMQSPTSKKLQEFLGLIQYLSPFMDNLSERAAPLRDLLKKDVPFEWDRDHQHQYDKIKTLISSDACIQ